jgi:hypothetical protein
MNKVDAPIELVPLSELTVLVPPAVPWRWIGPYDALVINPFRLAPLIIIE